jgi:hypothetical protein
MQMASASYIRKKQERASERGRKGAYARFEKHKQSLGEFRVVGGCRTYGNLGKHHIELLACDDPECVWIRVDGRMRCPRTMRGFKAVMSEWFYGKAKKECVIFKP